MHRFLSALALGTLLASGTAAAAQTRTTCVHTEADLLTAIAFANADPEGSIHDIRITQGTYDLPAGFEFAPEGSADDKTLLLRGGWDATCSSRTLLADATTIDAGGGDIALLGTNKRIVIDGLRLEGFNGFVVNQSCPLLAVCPTLEEVSVKANRFVGGTLFLGLDGVSNAFQNNVGSGLDEARFVCGKACEASFNTLAFAGCGANGKAVTLSSGSTSSFHHNIIRSNCSGDLHLQTPWKLSHNLLESRTGVAPISSVGTVVAADPGFVDGTTDFHLRETVPVSPAINAGMTQAQALAENIFFPSRDHDGPDGQRLIGSRVDIGAYESAIQDSQVLYVTSNADSGPGTLRTAINSANALAGAATIQFDFGADPQDCGPASTIVLQSPLPPVTDSLTIDGYSAALAYYNDAEVGFDASVCVILNDGADVAYGLQVPAGAGNADVALSVRGLQFNGFAHSAIYLAGGAGHAIEGNIFGGTGTSSNGRGVYVGQGVSGTVVGGVSPQQRNWIGQSSVAAVQLQGASNHVVGNLIGPDANGLKNVLRRNLDGVAVSASGNEIRGNTISGNLGDAVEISIGQSNVVADNLIGFNDARFCPVEPCSALQGNARGVVVFDSNNEISGNEIGGSVMQGIVVGTGTKSNALIGNRLEANGGLGIELGSDGLPAVEQAPDTSEPANAPNGGQNFPALTSASGSDTTGIVKGTLSSRNGNYEVELFASLACDGSGHGEGERWIGSGNVAITDGITGLTDGDQDFSIPVKHFDGLLGQQITAVARNLGNGNTSEFSACIEFQAVNTAPTVEGGVIVLSDDALAGSTVALKAVDDGLPTPPGALAWTLVASSVPNPPFTLSTDGVLTLTSDAPFASNKEYILAVKADDGALSNTALVAIRPVALFRNGFE